MKKFFTQPVGQLARQNCIGFIGCNLYLIGNGFGLYEGPEGINRIFNFAWAFTLLGIILGTLIEISFPEFRENGFAGMYFLWAFNTLTFVLTTRGTGVFRPVYEYLSIFAFTFILIGSGAQLFFDYTPPESIQPLFGIGWIAMIIGLGVGSYVAWGDKMSLDTE